MMVMLFPLLVVPVVEPVFGLTDVMVGDGKAAASTVYSTSPT